MKVKQSRRKMQTSLTNSMRTKTISLTSSREFSLSMFLRRRTAHASSVTDSLSVLTDSVTLSSQSLSRILKRKRELSTTQQTMDSLSALPGT